MSIQKLKHGFISMAMTQYFYSPQIHSSLKWSISNRDLSIKINIHDFHCLFRQASLLLLRMLSTRWLVASDHVTFIIHARLRHFLLHFVKFVVSTFIPCFFDQLFSTLGQILTDCNNDLIWFMPEQKVEKHCTKLFAILIWLWNLVKVIFIWCTYGSCPFATHFLFITVQGVTQSPHFPIGLIIPYLSTISLYVQP